MNFVRRLLVLLVTTTCVLGAAKRYPCKLANRFQKAESSLKFALSILNLTKHETEDPDYPDEDGKDFKDIQENYSYYNVTRWTNLCLRKDCLESTKGTSTQKCQIPPTNCADILAMGYTENGVYEIFPRWRKASQSSKVLCDLTTDGGGWTVIQKRTDRIEGKRQLFNLSYEAYRVGFGKLGDEFWIGNELIHNLTNQERMILRIELEDWEGQKRFAHYTDFIVENAENKFKMNYLAYVDNTAGADGLAYSKGQFFATADTDFKSYPATNLTTGFWLQNINYNNFHSNLNGQFYPKDQHLNKINGIFWNGFRGLKYSLRKVEMKLRPRFLASILEYKENPL